VVEISRFYHLSLDRDEDDLVVVARIWHKVVGRGYVPIAHDAGNNQLMLRYGKKREPDVVMCYFDEGTRPTFHLLASSFEQFVDSLQPSLPLDQLP
jgi:hypothetical protein